MILELKPDLSDEEEKQFIARLEKMGFTISVQANKRLALVRGLDDLVVKEDFARLPQVKAVHLIGSKYKLASRIVKPEATIIEIKGRKIGGGELFVMAGPCTIESEAQLMACAAAAVEAGAASLRGGAYKPRTSPYDFQGLGEEGLKLLQKVGNAFNLVTVTEVMEPAQVELVATYADILQIGARNMQNFPLLKELGKVKNPILLKRGFSATYADFLMAAEYIMSAGNPNVILCERGIRTFETHTRNTLDLTAVPVLREMTHLPIAVDPSHGTGLRSLVEPMAIAAAATGCDALMIEMHPNPNSSVSDAQQTISLEAFTVLMRKVRALRTAIQEI